MDLEKYPDTPLTARDAAMIANDIAEPFYALVGGALAVLVIGAAVFVSFVGVKMLYKRVL